MFFNTLKIWGVNLMKNLILRLFVHSREIIVADTERLVLDCFRVENGKVERVCELSGIPIFIGKSGASHIRREGSNITPKGIFKIPFLFGFPDMSDKFSMPFYTVTENSYWVCDSESPFYNTLSEIEDFSSFPAKKERCERLCDFPDEYKFAAVIGYNEKRKKGLGSGIFLHCGKKETAGCIAVSEEKLFSLLSRLKYNLNPVIVIK